MLVHWLWLAERPYVGNRLKVELLTVFSDPERIYAAQKAELFGIEGMNRRGADSLMDKDLARAEAILRDCAEKRIRIVTYQDSAYPQRLRNIYDPPVVLYCKGILPEVDAYPAIGMVGTRHPSPYGEEMARRLGYEIASCGGIVVSGLAEGIDGASMWGALDAGGAVIGVLGSGADIVFPACNRELFRLTEEKGCILTEFPPGIRGNKWTFPQRNRLISGLCCGTVVVEAPEKSGSLITARCASEQGRDVFVIPGNVNVPGFVGSNRLLRTGAIAVSTGWDILSEYEGQFGDKIREVEIGEIPAPGSTIHAGQATLKTVLAVAESPVYPEKKRPDGDGSGKKSIDNKAAAPYIDVNMILKGLSSEEQTVLLAIGREEQLVDDVIQRAGIDAGKVLALLTMLELKGKIRRLPGKRICLTGK